MQNQKVTVADEERVKEEDTEYRKRRRKVHKENKGVGDQRGSMVGAGD